MKQNIKNLLIVLVQSSFKVVGAWLIQKGLAEHSQLEEIFGGIGAAIGIAHNLYHLNDTASNAAQAAFITAKTTNKPTPQ